MNRTSPDITKNHLRRIFAFAAAILIVLMSCSVKRGIKSLAGIPVNTEQGLAKNKHGFIGAGSETCLNGETTDTKISQTASFNPIILLPAVILTAAFLFLVGYTPRKEQFHPLYGNLKIPGTLPLFLLYRKLLVYYSI